MNFFITWCKVSFLFVPIISGDILNPLDIYFHNGKHNQPHHTLSSFGFASLEDQYHSKKDSHKELDWRENVEEYLDFNQEPSCEQLQEMWRLVKAFQSASKNSRHIIPPSIQPLLQIQTKSAGPFNYGSFKYSPESHYKQTRRRTPTTDEQSGAKERPVYIKSIPNDRFQTNSSLEKTERNKETKMEEMTNNEKFFNPKTKGEDLAVRDPAKEIFGYLQHRHRDAQDLTSPVPRGNSQIYYPYNVAYGNLSHRDKEQNEMHNFDKVARNVSPSLMVTSLVSQPPSYGIIKYEEPHQPKSPFDKVRALVARNRAKDHQNLLSKTLQDDKESSSFVEDQAFVKNPFDLIRKKLLHLPELNPEQAMRSIRRRRSKSRHQKVENILRVGQSLQKQ